MIRAICPGFFPDAFYERYHEENVQHVNRELRKLTPMW